MNKALEIYIHIPFCAKKCDYCDFFSMEGSNEEKEVYGQALLAEIEATRVGTEYEVCSIFLGGGTPSILDAKMIGKILGSLRNKFNISEDVEITIECNPGTVDEEKLAAYKGFGVNRISFGLQSTDNDELLGLGRIHTYQEFLQGYEDARKIGFKNISVDLMSGLPNQSISSWYKTLKTIGQLAPEHISAYSLIIEAGTPFAKRKLELPDEIAERKMYEETYSILKDFGYHQYEISNYAKAGFECRHNIGYWERVEYLGFGPTAASLFKDTRYNNTNNLQRYLEDSGQPEKIHSNIEQLDEKDKMEEFIFLGLRMIRGIHDTKFKDEFGVSLRAVYGDEIDRLVEQGQLIFDEHDLKLTRPGISVSNYVFAELLNGEK